MDEKPESVETAEEKENRPQKKGLDFNVVEARSSLPFVVMVILSLIVLAGLLIVWLKFL